MSYKRRPSCAACPSLPLPLPPASPALGSMGDVLQATSVIMVADGAHKHPALLAALTQPVRPAPRPPALRPPPVRAPPLPHASRLGSVWLVVHCLIAVLWRGVCSGGAHAVLRQVSCERPASFLRRRHEGGGRRKAPRREEAAVSGHAGAYQWRAGAHDVQLVVDKLAYWGHGL